MQKGPLVAIALSIVLVFSIYLFVDIRSPEVRQTESVETNTTADFSPTKFIETFNTNLAPEELESLNEINERISRGGEEKASAIDSLIVFYERNEQFNFAAHYHVAKAEHSNLSKDWELAGDRLYSVSRNEAYNPQFGNFLYNQAKVAFNKAIAIDSTNLDAKVKLASYYLEQEEETMSGILLLLDVVKEDSMQIDANLLLAKYGLISQQYDKAIKRLENILSLQPQNTEALFLKGEALSGMGDIPGAITAFEQCSDLMDNEELKAELDALINGLKDQLK